MMMFDVDFHHRLVICLACRVGIASLLCTKHMSSLHRCSIAATFVSNPVRCLLRTQATSCSIDLRTPALTSITANRISFPRVQRSMSTTSPASDFPPSAIRPILEEVTSLLKSRGETISIAETAAGGLISSSILSTPGASKIYQGGLTLYTLPSRIAYAGWTQESIANYKGPTTDIVSGLAKHVRKDLGSTYTLSESGTAGPTGGSTENRKPGYVALAVDCERGTFTREIKTGLGEDRIANMVQFTVEGLTLLRDVISGEAKL
jgi:PncC family amidohydrolase